MTDLSLYYTNLFNGQLIWTTIGGSPQMEIIRESAKSVPHGSHAIGAWACHLIGAGDLREA